MSHLEAEADADRHVSKSIYFQEPNRRLSNREREGRISGAPSLIPHVKVLRFIWRHARAECRDQKTEDGVCLIYLHRQPEQEQQPVLQARGFCGPEDMPCSCRYFGARRTALRDAPRFLIEIEARRGRHEVVKLRILENGQMCKFRGGRQSIVGKSSFFRSSVQQSTPSFDGFGKSRV